MHSQASSQDLKFQRSVSMKHFLFPMLMTSTNRDSIQSTTQRRMNPSLTCKSTRRASVLLRFFCTSSHTQCSSLCQRMKYSLTVLLSLKIPQCTPHFTPKNFKVKKMWESCPLAQATNSLSLSRVSNQENLLRLSSKGLMKSSIYLTLLSSVHTAISQVYS